jgi:hypothetical protein
LIQVDAGFVWDVSLRNVMQRVGRTCMTELIGQVLSRCALNAPKSITVCSVNFDKIKAHPRTIGLPGNVRWCWTAFKIWRFSSLNEISKMTGCLN